MRAGESAAQAGLVVEVGLHDLHALVAQSGRSVGVRVARDRSGGEAPVRIGQDRAHQPATLSARRAGHRRVRLRMLNGTWLVAHASPLAGSGQVALVLEPARASEIAPIVIEAYGMTPREVEVTRLIARGLSTDEIASSLFLSRHTVRDHLKAIFEKVGVSSRGELTSKLFAEHYHGPLNDALYANMDRLADRISVPVDA